MKGIKSSLMAIMLLAVASNANARPMDYYAMRDHARFLTDRMAYTLGLAQDLIDDLYMINYDYIYGVNDYLDDVAYGYYDDYYDEVLYRRDLAIRRLLSASQWALYTSYDYFYRPIFFRNHAWHFGIYSYDRWHNRFYFGAPRHFVSYRGGHFFEGMRPHGGHPGGAYRGVIGGHRGGNIGGHRGGSRSGNMGMREGGRNNGNIGGHRGGSRSGSMGMREGGRNNSNIGGNRGGSRSGSMGMNNGGRSYSNMRSSSRSSSGNFASRGSSHGGSHSVGTRSSGGSHSGGSHAGGGSHGGGSHGGGGRR